MGGSYQAARIIQFHVEFWDRTPLKEQQTIFGRDKHSGAPLGMKTNTIPRITVKILTAKSLRWIAIFVWPIPHAGNPVQPDDAPRLQLFAGGY